MKTVLVDSGAFLALDGPAERSPPQTVATFQELVGEGARLLTTNFVFDEAYTLLLVRLGRRRAVEWGESLRNSGLVRMERVDEDHEARAWEIILAFSDKDFSYTDATSFAVAENLGISEALSLDRHFHPGLAPAAPIRWSSSGPARAARLAISFLRSGSWPGYGAGRSGHRDIRARGHRRRTSTEYDLHQPHQLRAAVGSDLRT